MIARGGSRLRALAARVRGLLRGARHDEQFDEEFDEEIQEHLRLLAERFVARGMSRAEAVLAARRQFGNTTRLREDRWMLQTLPSIESLWHDTRYALRMLRRNPGFAAVAVLTLALGIGANTAILSLVNAVILQPLTYPRPEQLQFVTTRFGDAKDGQSSLSPAEYWELADFSRSFSTLGAFTLGDVNLAARDQPRRVPRATVNAELFEALAVRPESGRWFRPEETRAGGPPLVILSHELWQADFGARADIVGRTIEIDGLTREVIGIMPAGFDLLDRHVGVWLPLQLAPALRQFRASHFLSVVGRLKEGVTPEQADAELGSLVTTWGKRVGASDHVFSPGEHVMQMEPLQAELVGSGARRVLWVLQAAVGLVLLIACVNLANLLLARAGTRRREIAVRLALGASRWRLLRQFTIEGVVLSLFGAGVGVGVAWAGVRTLSTAYPDALPRMTDVALDGTVLGVTAVVSILTGIAFGLVPLLQVSRAGVARPLKDAGTRGSTRTRRVHGTLVAAEVAFAVVLAIGAGLMLRTVANLVQVDTGFERSRLATFGVALPTALYPFERQVQFYDRLIDRLETTPGVNHVAIASGLPPQRRSNGFGTDIDGYTPRRDVLDVVDYYQTITAGYFEAMRIPIVRGRAFQNADRLGAPVAVVNETFARTFWGDRDPIGRRLRPRFGDKTPWVTVVGVVKDVRQGGVDRPTGTEIYFLLDQLPRIFTTFRILNSITESGIMHVVVRGDLPLATLRPAVASAMREVDPSLPIVGLQAMDDVIGRTLRRPRMLMHLFGAFAGLSLLLAAIGAYGVLSYLVTQRRREIGIQVALGASRTAILREVMAHGLMLTLIGLAAGVSAAVVSTRLMESLLFEVSPGDPATLAGVAALITIVATAASLVPAIHATQVDPIVALREE
jgi:predicted permease